jgi:hypothetical protein
MHWMKSGRASWEAVFPLPGARATAVIRDLMRGVVVLALVGVLAYCLLTAWAVLGELSRVKLVDCKTALTVISVRDVVLCVIGYRLAIELLRAVVRPRPTP